MRGSVRESPGECPRVDQQKLTRMNADFADSGGFGTSQSKLELTRLVARMAAQHMGRVLTSRYDPITTDVVTRSPHRGSFTSRVLTHI